MDDLTGTIKTIKEKMDAYYYLFRNNEAMTRYALIDPLLRALGWDLSDPAMVLPEENLTKGGGKTDYTMWFGKSQQHGNADSVVYPDIEPVMIVEAKSLEANLDSTVGKIAEYMTSRGARYGLITDGQRWKLYGAGIDTKTERLKTYGAGTVTISLLAEFDIMEDSSKAVASKAAIFSRATIEKDVQTNPKLL